MSSKVCVELLQGIFHEPIEAFEVRPGCKEGENVGGSVFTIDITTESGKKIVAFFKTFPAEDNPHYRRVKESQIFRTEADVYTKLGPAIQNIINAFTSAVYILPFPKLYAAFNNDSDDYLCLQDVRPEGFKMPSVFQGLTYPECSLAIQELARFHAFTHALIRVQGEKIFGPMGQFHRLCSRFDSPDAMWCLLMENGVSVSVDILKISKPALAAKLNQAIPRGSAEQIWRQIVDRTDESLFPCIVHGDFWCNNFLIKYVGEKPEEIRMIDFQHTRRGNIFEDLLYFLFTSTSPAFRKEYLGRVLADYYGAFANAMEWIQCPLPPHFSHAFLEDRFDRLKRASLVQMCFAIPLQLGNPTKAYAEQKDSENDSTEDKEESRAEDEQVGELDLEVEAKKITGALRKMMESSEFARKRLEGLVEEVLGTNNN